jgi:acyl carrier protein
MGLDIVELILDVEDSFQIKFSDRDVGAIGTVGDLITHVRSSMQSRRAGHCETSRTFYRIRRHLTDRLALGRKSVRPKGRLEDLIPRDRRRQIWAELRSAGLRLPPLELGGVTLFLVFGFALSVGIAVAASMHTVLDSFSLALLSWFFIFALSFRALRPFAGHIPSAIVTVGDAVLLASPMASASNDEIAQRTRLIISHQLGVPIEKVTDLASFTKDLGAD